MAFWFYLLGLVLTAVLVRGLPTRRNRRTQEQARKDVDRCGRSHRRVQHVPSWVACITVAVFWPLFVALFLCGKLGQYMGEGFDALTGG